MTPPAPWPSTEDNEPGVARWRQAVQERIDHGFAAVLDELAEIKVTLDGRSPMHERCAALLQSSMETGALKWVILLLVFMAVAGFGSGVYVTWGDFTVGKDSAHAEE